MLNQPKFHIDFNEMIDCDLILLSKTDFKKDVNGNSIELKEGMKITVLMEDIDEFGKRDDLIANGTVEKNNTGISKICKWNFRIDINGIQYESDVK